MIFEQQHKKSSNYDILDGNHNIIAHMKLIKTLYLMFTLYFLALKFSFVRGQGHDNMSRPLSIFGGDIQD